MDYVSSDWDSITARVRDRDLESLLSRKKLHLVLDLDHTLVHCVKGSKLTVHDKELFKNSSHEDSYLLDDGAWMLKLRPGVRSFLEKANAMFDFSIYTMGSVEYAKRVAKVLDPEDSGWFGDLNLTIYSRENCTVEKQKGLDIVLSHPRAVLIVDDKPTVWAENDRENVLTVSPYHFFGKSSGSVFYDESKEHRELDRVLALLSMVHFRFYCDNFEGDDCHSRDVVKVLERVRTIYPTLFEPREVKEVKSAFKTLSATLTLCEGDESRKRSRESLETSCYSCSTIDNKTACKDYQVDLLVYTNSFIASPIRLG